MVLNVNKHSVRQVEPIIAEYGRKKSAGLYAGIVPTTPGRLWSINCLEENRVSEKVADYGVS